MRVFVDTEFTDFVQIDLISIALVSEDGHEFYAERNDYRAEDCCEFVREAVLPLLGRIEGAICNRTELTLRLRTWFESLPEPATLMFDYFADWELLADAFLGDDFDQPPINVGEKQMLTSEFIGNPIFQRALYNSFTPDWPAHHALADARAFLHAFHTLNNNGQF
ncbi:3'-5' exoribonuclease [Deefgea tanakiae]|uniref:3'-5' exoribonuclease n=1 Tax=Deefgea tanakiae TaxID=2865840 RepID=A0ABX8Z8I9_9NEIS|nr:3'-5' exoribonuclease [Deefgea tanakiae]QZA77475.1 3'-5' exoribonuclease [Deefgea tanakiae]